MATHGGKLMGRKSFSIILWWLVILLGPDGGVGNREVETSGSRGLRLWNQLRWEGFVQEIAL